MLSSSFLEASRGRTGAGRRKGLSHSSTTHWSVPLGKLTSLHLNFLICKMGLIMVIITGGLLWELNDMMHVQAFCKLYSDIHTTFFVPFHFSTNNKHTYLNPLVHHWIRSKYSLSFAVLSLLNLGCLFFGGLESFLGGSYCSSSNSNDWTTVMTVGVTVSNNVVMCT